ncbi:pimeloyl-ACP methyl ester carboxylesterase [Bacillus pakistanensis]|uniref:Pimeloyl-ACP methyl ester carboxylesterase n=1 Tax=Rossellomorea pakistanensis TaxID=992288 RepID=A0ABS2NIX0_9BACI|nr:alpha/beta hydrolase [Bacillus pakistanensis]MBM7587768.1 pimeloyl-ACP methyl ester carboxylesterase [Bacillus pakistanensis]
MPYFTVEKQVNLYYEESGSGIPVIFLHGVWMSSRFFHEQPCYFSKNHRVITLDFRSHGESSKVEYGHTISQYARDLHAFIEGLGLKEVVLVGWSMGAFVAWEYLSQFGEENVKGSVIVDELASDFKWADFPMGAFDFPALMGIMREIQENRIGFLQGFLPLMFKADVTIEQMKWMMDEVTKVPESVASAILFDQSVVDYREHLGNVNVPTLLCFGREEKLIPLAAGEYLKENLKNSELIIFENSCHCPFLEESDKFNKVVDEFISSL